MSSPKPLEEQLLDPTQRVLKDLASSQDARLEILEAVSSRVGGFSLHEYRNLFQNSTVLSESFALESASTVINELRLCPIPLPLALSALARPNLAVSEQRTSGAYYTDFRLAQYLAASVLDRLVPGAQIIDPAAGTGILLVAATLVACGDGRQSYAKWLSESVTAWDLSRDALRGARLALASLTSSLDAVAKMSSRWKCHDSLLAEPIPRGEYDVVIGNPPWEKVKLTRHEFLRANGGTRHYGDDYGYLNGELFESQRNDVARYGNALAKKYPFLGRGEPDLYKAFLELFVNLVRLDGRISVLVPAGLIRSQGTEELRRFIFSFPGELSFTIMENRARFFAIDTRFKFLKLVLKKSRSKAHHGDFFVFHAKGTDLGIAEYGDARISRKTMEGIRPDLTVPEVRSGREWQLFKKMSEHAESRTAWRSEIVREVDMTRDRTHFVRSPGIGRIPLIEGRMVHQHRFGAKAYRAGTGRRAKWDVVPTRECAVTPQFWFPQIHLSKSVSGRINIPRVGFCDITGQTNERSMLAALVPGGVVCGNKVPTVTFPNDPTEERLLLWLAVVNSISFDWALRRILTTTVNYFLLNSVPFPKIEPNSKAGRLVIEASRELHAIYCGEQQSDAWRAADLRASIDIAVHSAYGLGFKDLELIFGDFPLLDRGQPPINGEKRSTVTRDFLLFRAALRFKVKPGAYADRFRCAQKAGCVPYIPSEFLLTTLDNELDEVNNG